MGSARYRSTILTVALKNVYGVRIVLIKGYFELHELYDSRIPTTLHQILVSTVAVKLVKKLSTWN